MESTINQITANATETPVGIVISTPPTRTSYTAGERFVRGGMRVEYVYPSGGRAPVQSYTVAPDGALGDTDTFIEVRVGGFTARQSIRVAPKLDADTVKDMCCVMAPYYGYSYCPVHPEKHMDIDSIKIKTQPNKTRYFEGEFFDPTGMEVVGRVRGSDKYSINITSYEVSPKGALSTETISVRVAFKLLSAYVSITVIPRLNVLSVPASESVRLAGGVNGELYLASGELCPSFTDAEINSGALPFSVKHVYTNDGEDRNCGCGWSLNLHSTLKRSDDGGIPLDIINLGKDDVDFVYTDGAGVRHAFDEVFYYIDGDGNRQSVEREKVSVSVDGKLTCEVNGNDVEVVREFKTATGLILSARLEGVSGVSMLEQRHEDIAKLEKEIEQYTNAIAELKYNISQNKHYLAPVKNIDMLAICDIMGDYTSQMDPALSIGQVINDSQQDINRLSIDNKEPADAKSDASKEEKETATREKSLWKTKKVNQFYNQLYYESTKEEDLQRRKDSTAQYEYQIKEYNKILAQKKNMLAKYELQSPVAYLTDEDGVSLCFNKYGELCGIADKYENQIQVIWESLSFRCVYKRVITSVVCGERQMKFDYKPNGLLSQITNYDGMTVKYTYTSDRRIHDAIYSTEKRFTFAYNSYGEITSIVAPHVAEKSEISYAKGKAVNIEKLFSFNKLTDASVSPSSYAYRTEETSIRYGDGKITLQSDGKTKTVYLDKNGALAASCVKDGAGYTDRPSYERAFVNDKAGYAVRETADAVWHNDALVNPSQTPVAVITPDMLKSDASYVFGGEANKTTAEKFDGYSNKCKLPFCTLGSDDGGKVFRLRAKVYQSGKTEEYYAAFDASNDREQYIALPMSLNIAKFAELERIELYAECDSRNVVFDNLRFAPAECEYREKDGFGNVKAIETSLKQIAADVYAYTKTTLTYDNAHKHVVKENKITYTVGTVAPTVGEITEYEYCEHGNLVKTVSYINGEQNAKGKTVTERVCDERGNVVKEYTYNTLDSSTKFYKESEYAKDGTVIAETDESGENKTKLEYDDNGNVSVKTLPDGGKLAYGYDDEGNVTSITQSTDDGEANSAEIKYSYGSPTRLKSGNNTVLYEYDQKRRITKATVNGRQTAFAYNDNTSTESVTVSDAEFAPVKADKTTATFDGATIETYKDKRGNSVMTKIDGQVLNASTFDLDGKTLVSGDNVTGSVTEYMYDDITGAVTQIDVLPGDNVETLYESYSYNKFGQITKREMDEAVRQTYAYFYKNNKTKDLDYVTLPNALSYYPQTDVNGRNTGKLLKDGNKNVYGEYVYYRKVGDHGTNMPASVYFGKTENGRYAISDSIKYKYDKCGNIAEVEENGALAVRYSYDKLGRIVREDNKKLGKTVLWSYDNFGNILTKREAAFTLKPTDGIAEFTDEKKYSYDGDRLLSYGNEVILYADGEGNVQTNPGIYRGQVAEWNFGRQLKRLGDTVFAYDGYGRRLTKNNTVFTYDGSGKLVKQSDGNDELEFVYDNDGVCGVKHNGIDYIFGKDIQGNIISVLDITGREVVHYFYDAWGNFETSVLDETHAAIARLNPFRYRGYYYDTETNLYYLNTRYYDPEVGRFISQDDVSYLDPEHINGLNLFAYCGNNPVMNVDPSGEFFLTLFFGFLIGATVSFAVEVGKQIHEKGWDVTKWDWKQIGWSTLGGAVAGVISAIPLGGAIGAFFFGGVGAAVGGYISGTVTDFESGLKAFLVGAFTNLIGYGVAKGIESVRANNVMKLSPKAKSAELWKLKGVAPNTLSKTVRYSLKNMAYNEVVKTIRNASIWLRCGIQSSLVSSALSSIQGG